MSSNEQVGGSLENLRRLGVELEKARASLENVMMTKIQLEREIRETENAIEEMSKLKEGESAFKLVGYVLVKKSKEELLGELQDRLMVLKTQHKESEERAKRLQQEIRRIEREIVEENRRLRTPKAL